MKTAAILLVNFATAACTTHLGAQESPYAEGRLERTGRKYPTVWIPGKPVQQKSALIVAKIFP